MLFFPATNGGDSQAGAVELVCSSLGVMAANQSWWLEEKDRFKLHPSQSTGGRHESVTSRRFSPSWGSLQIDSDSTPLTLETPTRASPIKSLPWFPLLIINASELSWEVIAMCPWGVREAFLHMCMKSPIALGCHAFFLSMKASMCRVLLYTVALAFSFMWSSPPVCGGGYLIITNEKSWKPFSGNWRWHIEFQQEIRRGASLLTAEVDAGKPDTGFQEKKMCCCKHTLSLWLLLHIDPSSPGPQELMLKKQVLFCWFDNRLEIP